MSIEVTTTEQQITASVSGGSVAVGVSGGFGPSGAQGPSGVVAVTAPVTNSGSSTSANIGLAVGSGLQVSSGSLAVAFNSTAFTSAVAAAGAVTDAPADGTTYARKDGDWVDITSPANLQVRRGTAAEVAAITPLSGEPVWATDTKVLTVGDGSTAGGVVVAFPQKYAAAENAGIGVPVSVVLSPANSVWEVQWFANLGGSDYADNSQVTFGIGGFAGLGTPIGDFTFINSGGTASVSRLGTASITRDITGSGEYAAIKAIVAVTGSSGTFGPSVGVDNSESGQHMTRVVCIAKRIA